MNTLTKTHHSAVLLAALLFLVSLSLGLAGGGYFPSLSEAKPHGSIKKYSPRKYAPLPDKLQTKGCPRKCMVDARIKGNVLYLARKYNLRVSQARNGAPPSITHGDGTAVDLIGKKRKLRQAYRAVRDLSVIAYSSLEVGSHLHISWQNSCHGCGKGQLVKPRKWVLAFKTN